MKRETRTVTADALEVRADEDRRMIVGHAAVFNRDSQPIFGLFIERIAPGAFARAIAEGQDVRALINHDDNLVLGRTPKTLRLSEDATGLVAEIDPPDTSYAQDLMVSMERGDITQMSFAFSVRQETWERAAAPNGMDVRTLTDVDLYDVSAVTYPAYPDTDVALRSWKEWRRSIGVPCRDEYLRARFRLAKARRL